jgi:predicted glycogen debranching enzyme
MYEDVPPVTVQTNAHYRHDPAWYRNFLYEEERARGLDYLEDLASPGIFEYDLSANEAVCLLSSTNAKDLLTQRDWTGLRWLRHARETELVRRSRFESPLERAVEDYLVTRSKREAKSTTTKPGKTIIAGYPWFADWGRDTFIALRGLCLATGRLSDARDILLEWSGAVSEGMLPNRFPDQGEQPEYNSVDASLWFVIAAHEYLEAARSALAELKNGKLKTAQAVLKSDTLTLHRAITAILTGYSQGTRFGIRADHDGLLAAGTPGVQLTWMDAKVGDWVVTPRIGKPVEVQALWLNALWIGNRLDDRWKTMLAQGLQSFRERFWNTHTPCLFDVVDVNHLAGTVDTSFRPNQIFAVGGLPMPLLEGECARLVVEAVEDRLWTPLGLRSLAREEAGYTAHYQGGVRERDGSYHQGTVWPWLIGPFVEAWLRVRGNSEAAKQEARLRFLNPLLKHLSEAGLGHVTEIADAETPHTPRGCPFQAWSVGELLRLDKVVLAPAAKPDRQHTLQPV